MNYELAKELKDAGFPQGGINKVRGFNPTTMEPIMFPTLSELIEACGVEFDSLENLSNTNEDILWHASAHNEKDKEIAREEGSTPEEAVARLWLALNKKPL